MKICQTSSACRRPVAFFVVLLAALSALISIYPHTARASGAVSIQSVDHVPASFAVELFAGQTGTEVLTLSNDGAGPSQFSVYSVEVPVAGTTAVTHIIERPAVAARSVADDGRSRASGVFPARPAQSREVSLELRQDDLAVVVLSPDDVAPANLVDDLNSFPGIAAQMYPRNELSTITGDDLAGFDVAVLSNNNAWTGVNGHISTGNALADFIDDGGAVVVFNYAYDIPSLGFHLEGRFITDGYGPFEPGIGDSTAESSMVILQGGHPILNGASTVESGELVPRIDNSLRPDATLIAEWDDGFPLIAFNDKVVAVNASYSVNSVPNWSGDLDLIAYNAVDFIARHSQRATWLAFDPEVGTVAAGAQSVIDVNFDATGLAAGDYQADILVRVDEGSSASQTLTIPASLTVFDPAIVAGTVTSLGYCSDDLSALEGAQVELVSQSGSYSTLTGPGGSYQFEIDAAESPVTVSVTAAGHLDDSESDVALVPFDTVVIDFDLALDAACATVEPEQINETLMSMSGVRTVPLTIGNEAGWADLNWSMDTAWAPAGQQTLPPFDVAGSGERSPAAADLAGLLGGTLPGLSMVQPAHGLRVVDCDSEPGIMINDDGTVENGYGASAALVSEVRFVDRFTPEAYPAMLTGVCVAFITTHGSTSFNIEVIAYDDSGAGGTPGVELGRLAATVDVDQLSPPVAPNHPPVWNSIDLSPLGIEITDGSVYVGVTFVPQIIYTFMAADQSTDRPAGHAGGYWWTDNTAVWTPIQQDYPNYRALMIRPVLMAEMSGCDFPADVPWLSTSPTAGTVAGGDSTTVDVMLDASGMVPGLYEAMLCVNSNDAINPLIPVPVTMEVEPDIALIEGMITSLGHCSDNPSALEGALIEVAGSLGGSWSATSGPDGAYQLDVHSDESPVTINVTAPDHLAGSESGVTVTANTTTTVDFDLVLDAACATVAPDDFAFTLYPGENDAASLEIGNVNGAGVLDWTVFSAEIMASDPRAHFPAVPYVAEPADRSDSSAAASEGRTSLHGPDEAGGLLDAAVPVYTTTGWDAPGYITLDALVPGPYTVINATQPARVYAAAFIDNDFSTHYGVASTGGDLPLNSFIAIDTATGTFETLGTVSDGPAGGFNSMKWDHTTSTLYAASRDSLYTIDPDTFQAELVGPFGPAGSLVVAIAISPEGLMYALDIASDALLAVDKTTGEAAAIGPLGLDANYAQDMDFDPTDGTLYWGSYLRNFDSEVRVIDPATGASTSLGHIQGGTELMSFSIALPGQTGCFSAADIEWLEVAPVSGSTAAGSSDLVTVSVNAGGLAPGLYEADVCVASNDPVHSLMAVPVSLLVEVPPAVVSGTVRGLGYCSADPAGLAGALVEAQGSDGGSFSVTTDGSGFYQFEVFAEDSPLTLSTGFDGHNNASITVEFEPGEQVNGNLDLLLSIPCAAVLPDSLDINLDAGSSLTGQIEVSNATGGAPLVWNIDSAEVSADDDAVRLVQCDDPEGFSWLKFSPVFGVTPAGTASHLNVTLDASSLQPGQYQAGLCIASNDAHNALQSVPITLNVRTPGTWGDGLDGTVMSQGYCGDNPAPLEGATVTAVGTGFTRTTDADGYFSFALNPDQGPYELTVTHPDHLPASESGINPPATVDFDLALDAACATVDPEEIAGSALTGGTDLQTLTISNHGAAELDWSMDEALPATLPPSRLQLSMGRPATGDSTFLTGFASDRVDTGNLLNLGPYQMSQTTDTNISGSSVGCPTGPNHLLRRFYYDEHPGVGNGIESVDVAIQEAAASTSLTVNLYTLASSTPVDTIPVGDLVLIGTATASISGGDDGTLVNVPVIGVVDDMSASDLVVEVVANQSFFIGATSSGETHPGFVMASACGITSPTPVRDVGPDFVNTHIILVVNATPGSGCTAPEDVPWLSTSPTSGTVAGGDSATVDVMLDASNLSPGLYEAELCVNSNDAGNPLIPVPVSLQVLDLDSAELGVDPAALDFGTVPVGDEVTQSFSVSNRAEVGSAALVLTGLDVSGDAGFSLSGGDCALNTELEPGDSCLVEISFTPGAEAVFEAEVTIAANAQQATVALSGTGRTEPPADPIFSDRFEEEDADDEG